MAAENSSSTEAFDLDLLQKLTEFMEAHDLSEIDLRSGDVRWRLRRGPQEVMQMVPAAQFPSPPAAPHPGDASAAAKASGSEDDGTVKITSPTVGTFYAAPSPDDPPFVEVGSKVSPDTIVCTIEAMKVFNQIPAEVSGSITELLVTNGDPVEFGQPLFSVRPD